MIITDETKIDELDLSVRAYNCLMRTRITTVGELQRAYKDGGHEWLIGIKNMGQKAAAEIEAKLKEIDGKVLTKREDDELIRKLFAAGVREIEEYDQPPIPRVKFTLKNGQVVDINDGKAYVEPQAKEATPKLTDYQLYMAAMVMAIVANTGASADIEAANKPFREQIVDSSISIVKTAQKAFVKIAGMDFAEWSKKL